MDWDAPLSSSGGVSDLWGAGAWDDYTPPPSGRSADPLSPYFVDPKITEIVSRHPTLVDCIKRGEEITAWHERMDSWDSGRRFRLALQGMPPALFVAALVLFIMGLWGLAAASALVIPAVLMWSALYRGPKCPELPAPTRLLICPYEDSENAFLMLREEPTKFRSVCGCPGCGDVDTHQIVRGTAAARVIRKCATCNREWLQS